MSASPPPRATLGALLSTARLELRLDDRVSVADAALDVEVRWVHSSDLADPTPFLSDDVVLLTTGTQFESTDAARTDAVDAYVARLRSRGVIALGFGTEVVREGIPAELAGACATAGLPLFEVPYRIPFIAIARANAEAIAAQARARQDWALAAQRDLARAALRTDGLEATIAELARQLGAWVGLFDGRGRLTVAHAARTASVPDRTAIDAEVAALVARGGAVGARVGIDGRPVSLLTIGARGRAGVLAVAGIDLDREARGLVTSVIATMGLALEQSSVARRAETRLRAIVVRLLEDGAVDTARAVARAAWDEFPAPPWSVAIARAPHTVSPDASRALDRFAERSGAFVGASDDDVLVIAPEGAALAVREAFERLSWRTGTASSAREEDLPGALADARRARDARGDRLVVDAADLPRRLVAELATPASAGLAARLLAPVTEHDATHGTALLETLVAWMRGDASNDVAASALGVHRHTVRARIRLAQQLLGLDLGAFEERANVWAALQLAALDGDREGQPGP